MFNIVAVLLVVLLMHVDSGEQHCRGGDCGCPPWTYSYNSTSCQCGSSVDNTIKCNITTGVINLQSCLYMTYDPIAIMKVLLDTALTHALPT